MKKIIFALSLGLMTIIGATNLSAAELGYDHDGHRHGDRHDRHHRGDRYDRHDEVKKECVALFRDSYGRALESYVGWEWVSRRDRSKSEACRYAMGKCLDDNKDYRTGSCTTSDGWVRYTYR